MQDEIASFLSFQVRRSTESGNAELAMAQMQRFLELERESKARLADGGADQNSVLILSRLRAIN